MLIDSSQLLQAIDHEAKKAEEKKKLIIENDRIWQEGYIKGLLNVRDLIIRANIDRIIEA